jgi:hypothetical protein
MKASDDVGALCAWVAARQRQLRFVVYGWCVVTVTVGLLALMSDRVLFLPLAPLSAAGIWMAAAWGGDHVWRVRSRVHGYPVVRAEAPWSLAAHRPMPYGWNEAPVSGTVHRTSKGWVWKPSSLVAADLPVLGWAAEDVAATTLTPLWSPGLPPRAQLRLYLRGGTTVELIVHDPWRLHTVVPFGATLNA